MIELGTVNFWEQLQSRPADLAAEICTIDLVKLDETLQKHPALRAWILAAHEVARINEEKLKWELTKVRATALLKAKAQADPDNPSEKPRAKTVAVVDAEVETSAQVRHATHKLLEQQEVRGLLRAIADALRDRTDMLVQLAARQREEMKEYRQ